MFISPGVESATLTCTLKIIFFWRNLILLENVLKWAFLGPYMAWLKNWFERDVTKAMPNVENYCKLSCNYLAILFFSTNPKSFKSHFQNHFLEGGKYFSPLNCKKTHFGSLKKKKRNTYSFTLKHPHSNL